jgi:hypothetical protein
MVGGTDVEVTVDVTGTIVVHALMNNITAINPTVINFCFVFIFFSFFRGKKPPKSLR